MREQEIEDACRKTKSEIENLGDKVAEVLVLPLYIPVLVFGAGVVRVAQDGLPTDGLLAVLGAILALALSLGPVAVALGLRISAGD